MSFGIIEVITLLLGMSGFGVQSNPKAPTADVALQYAMPDADVVIHFDAASVIPGNYKVLKGLPDAPAIKASPELSRTVRKVIGEMEGMRGLAKTATGIDLATDVNDATVFVQVVPKRDPNFVAVVHGKFSAANIEKIAKMGRGGVAKVGGGTMVETGANDPAIGVTKDGILIAGTPNLVRDRLNDGWKAPARATGSNLAAAAEVIDAKPVWAMIVTLSPTARKAAVENMPGKNFLTDIIQRHKVASFSVFSDGIGWTWIDSSRAGLDSMETMSIGTLELLKAANIAPRAFAKIVMGAIDSYKGTSKQIDDMIRRKADVMKIVETYTGDGNFKQLVSKDPKALKLTVRAQGKSLSEVVPASFVMFGAAMTFMTRSGGDMKQPAPMLVEPAPAPKQGGLGGAKKK